MELDWKNLSFGYLKTDYNIRSYYRNGSWSEPELTSDETVSLHMAATCLHYGQEVFEGQKAFRGADGVIRIFRPEENAKRLQSSADYLKMAIPPVDLVVDMMKRVVKANERFVPPYGTGASLYIRPLLLGTSAQVGVNPSQDYLLLMFVTPVGPYYKEGFNPIKVMIGARKGWRELCGEPYIGRNRSRERVPLCTLLGCQREKTSRRVWRSELFRYPARDIHHAEVSFGLAFDYE